MPFAELTVACKSLLPVVLLCQYHGTMGVIDRMAGQAAALGRAAVVRPLDLRELAAAAFVLLVGGTLYCAIYCRVAYYPMHDGSMPLLLSAWWAATTLLPWLAAFELVKRLVPRFRAASVRVLACLVIAFTAAALTVFAHWVGDIKMMGMWMAHWPMLAASLLQPTLIFILLVCTWASRSRGPDLTSDVDSHSGTLPMLTMIDWIRAAGNYVELKCGERLLIRRMTMRDAEAATRSADFIRIHRSVIVRRPLIQGFAGTSRSRVQLTTGEILPVGDSYRPTVERLVPSSQDLALQPIKL